MKPQVMLWLCSAAGALLFFAAGLLAVRRRPIPATPTARAIEEVPAAELLTLRGEAAGLRQQASAAHGEVDRLRQTLAAAEGQLHKRDGEAQRLGRALEEVQARSDQEAARWQAQKKLLDDQLARVPRLEAELEQRRQEVHRWRLEVKESEDQLAKATSPEAEQTLRQDLAIKSQQLQVQEERVRHLETENAKLRQEVASAASVRDERDRLRTENAELRAREFAARPAVVRPRAVPVPVPAGAKRGDVFQAFVVEVSRLADVRCAVIADELGLVVASQGELSDEVAAVGALFARAGGKAKEVLPMRNIHHVTIEDDQRVALTLRPLHNNDGVDSDLTLITLGVGAAPDAFLINKLINSVPKTLLTS
jgi:hypothetical protein